MLLSFSRLVDVKHSNEAEVLAIREALGIFKQTFQGGLLLEILEVHEVGTWAAKKCSGPWKLETM